MPSSLLHLAAGMAADESQPGTSLAAQRLLHGHLLRRLGPPGPDIPDGDECIRMSSLWLDWMEREAERCPRAEAPASAADFLPWYRSIFRRTVERSEPFFEHLAERGTIVHLARYVAAESLVDGRFDDVIALAQIGLDDHAKLALARNYWDEMGEGSREQMHTVLFADSARRLAQWLPEAAPPGQPDAAALRNGNMLLLFALERRYALRLLGAITLLEHTAPHRFAATVRAMRRLGVPQDVIHYHELHIRIDARHGDDLLHEVLLPLIARTPEAVHEVALGMQMRAAIAADYYDSLQRGVQAVREPAP